MQKMMPQFWALLWTLTSAVQVDATVVRSNNHVKSICSMWGKDHYKTFDGDIYQFPGMCEYNLASDCHSSFQDFSVHVQKKVDDRGKITVSKVTVTIKDLPIDLTKQIIRVAGEIISTPYHVSGILIEENSVYANLHYKLGLSVMWNKDDAVMVELDSKYVNRTCGLCGDYNGAPVYDEFIHQGRQIGSIEYGNKQRIHNPNAECQDPYEEDIKTIRMRKTENAGHRQQGSNLCVEARASCARRLISSDWASCASVLDPSPYIGACSMNLCQEPADSSSMCPTLAEYSRQCSHARGIPPNWRTKKFCGVKCPYNMVYLESGSPCMTTCTHLQSNMLCEDHHIDGCFCPEGTVFDDLSKRGCIPKEQCQCKHDRIYDNGEVLKTDTEECSCHEGQWSCVSHAHSGTCAVEEGSHVSTFDGKTYNFHGNCLYVLSKDCVDSKFSILGELAPCSTQDWDTCLKRVVVRLMGDSTNDIFIQANGKVHLNAEVHLPYSNGYVTIFQPSSFHIILQTHLGLQLQIQLVPIMQLYISMDQSFKNKTCGLCGNYNMVLSDDLRSTQGIVEGTAASFANSWKAQASCADSHDRLDDPCSLSVDNDVFAEHWCSLLKTKESTFSKCHSAVNPEIYYKRCKYASCTCDKSEECLCAAVSSYVRACATKGIFLSNWRDTVCNKYIDRCPATQTFSYQLKDCQRTCRSLNSDRQSCLLDFLPVDGCACPEGLYLDDSGMCIEMSKCPCLHNGDYIGPGKSITIKNEHCVCTNGKPHCRSGKTPSTGCPAPMVFFNCSAMDISKAGMECVGTCMQRDVDCIPVECESGCRCPSNLLDDGRGHCVEEHDCPCQHDGQFYASGSQIPVKCNNCTCNNGKWSCSNDICSSTCSIYGSGHYQTFDDQRFGFNGDCGYVAVKDSCGFTSGNFTVITENIPCGTTGATCSKAVRIVLGRTELKLSDGKYVEVDLGTGPKIKYTVRNVGLYLVIESVIGLTAFWDRRTTVRIILQPEHMGKVCGLCGNYNGDGKDDFTTQNELLVSDVLEFANSWKVTTSCPDAEDNFDPCFKNPNRHTWAKMHCSIIKGETFKNCHAKVDPTPYFDNCVKDSCACDDGGDCECFCTAVAAYAQACNEAGICVAWRTPEICPVYCDYYNGPAECTWHYSPCHTPCYKTCLHPDGICSDPLPNLEGCYPVCPPDKPIFDEGKRICVEKCEGCFIDGHEYKPGEEVSADTPCTSCICNQYGNLTCNQIPGCCVYNETEYKDHDVIYNVTDNMGMCYYAICINETVILINETCMPTPSPSTTTQTTRPPVSTTFTTEKTTVLSSTSGKPSPPSPTPSATGRPTETTTTTPTPGTSTPSQPPTRPTTITTPETTTTTPSTAKPSPPSTPISTTPMCVVCEWTEWFNVDTPSLTEDDDETYENIRKHDKEICEKPENITCRAKHYEDMSFEEFVQETGQVVQCNVSFGLLCETHKQLLPPKKCYDYKIKVYCCKPCLTMTGAPVSISTSKPTPVETTTTISTPETSPSPGTSTTTGPIVSTPTPSPTPASKSTTVETTATTTTPETTPSIGTTTTGPPVSTPTPGQTPTSKPTPVETTGTTSTPGTSPSAGSTTTTGPIVSTPTPSPTPASKPTTVETTATTMTPETTPSIGTTTTGPPVSTPTPGPTPPSTPATVETTAVTSTPGTTRLSAPTTTTGPQSTTEITPVTGPAITTSTHHTGPSHVNQTTRTSAVTPASTTAKKETPTTTGPLVSTPTPGPTPTSKPTTVETTATTLTPGTHPSSGTTTTTGPIVSTSTPSPTPASKSTTAETTAITVTPGTTPSPGTTTTGPLVSTPTPSPTPTSKPTTVKTTATTLTPGTHPSSGITTTTTCVCTLNGIQYNPGDLIYDRHHIGSGICLTIICSDICEIQNSTGPCQTTTPTVSTTPTSPECPEWGKKHNEIFMFCNCTMARCIEDNIIEIIPYECPPLKNITCANGKKPVLVWDEYHCCQKYACDCYCEGWGDPHYVTFDGLSYSHQGNCTYVLMEEIHPVFNFKIYVDNVKCDPREDVSCPRSIIISYKSDVITLKNNNLMGAVKLEAQRDGTALKLPNAKDGVRVASSGLKLIYEIPQLQIAVTFGIVGFTVNLPYQHFGNNTQGHCGTCNNNPHDDCRLPDGRLVENCAIMADFWPAKHVQRPDCPVPSVVPTGTPVPLPTLRPCNEHSVCDLIKSDLFAKCHPHISPDRFYNGCVFDSCHMSNPAVECTSLQTYAEACAQVGVCVYWRNHTTLCASDCPVDKVYKPCGPAEPPTCDSDPSEPGMNMVIEGCFCAEGTKLFSKESGVCVDKCGCLDPESIAREFNERFEYMCQDCVCEEDTRAVSCQVKQCPPPSVTSCTDPGFALVNTTDPANPCCPQLSCRCDSSLCPTPSSKCAVGYEPVLTFTEGKCCQDIICEPKNICLHKGAEYKPGESLPVIDCQECQCTTLKDPHSEFLQVNCKMVKCKEECEAGYEYQYDYREACCGECIQTRCSLNISGTVSLIEPGSPWSPPDNKCETYSCTKVGDKLIVTKSDIQCPPFNEENCQPGTTQTLSNGCCQVCEPIEKGCKLETVLKTITYQGCQSEDEVEIAYCEGTCNGYSKYSELQASMKRACMCCRESRTSERTVTLTCLDGSKMPHTYMHVEQCQCSNTLCDEHYPWPRKNKTGKGPIIKRSVLDRGG